MDIETYDLIARIYLSQSNFGTVNPSEIADWAVSELEQGRDSKHLRILASAFDAKSRTELEVHFRQSLVELDWEYPTKEVATKRYSESIMQRIVKSEIEPFEGCKELCNLCIYLEYPKDLYNWNALYWAQDELDRETLSALILEEAENRLNGVETEPLHEGFMYRSVERQSTSFWQRAKGLIK